MLGLCGQIESVKRFQPKLNGSAHLCRVKAREAHHGRHRGGVNVCRIVCGRERSRDAPVAVLTRWRHRALAVPPARTSRLGHARRDLLRVRAPWDWLAALVARRGWGLVVARSWVCVERAGQACSRQRDAGAGWRTSPPIAVVSVAVIPAPRATAAAPSPVPIPCVARVPRLALALVPVASSLAVRRLALVRAAPVAVVPRVSLTVAPIPRRDRKSVV